MTTRKRPARPAPQESAPKRPQGRPPREPDLVRLTVYLPRELKRWLQHAAIDAERDMGELVTDALQAMRAKQQK